MSVGLYLRLAPHFRYVSGFLMSITPLLLSRIPPLTRVIISSTTAELASYPAMSEEK